MLPGAGITRIRFERSGATSPPSQPGPTELPCCTATVAIHCPRHITMPSLGCWVLVDPTPALASGGEHVVPPGHAYGPVRGLRPGDRFWQLAKQSKSARGCSA